MIKSMNKRKENSLFCLISNSLFANIGKKINADIVFILFNAGASRFYFMSSQKNANSIRVKRIMTFGFVLFYFFSLFYSIKAP